MTVKSLLKTIDLLKTLKNHTMGQNFKKLLGKYFFNILELRSFQKLFDRKNKPWSQFNFTHFLPKTKKILKIPIIPKFYIPVWAGEKCFWTAGWMPLT
jgi:hypothetical protein